MVRGKGLIITLMLLLVCYGFLEFTKVSEKDNLYDVKIEASQNLEMIFKEVKRYRIEADGEIDRSIDINDTGLIGPRFTRITTTLGSLEAKRTSTNPNIAAMVVQLMVEGGVSAGDKIAVNVSSSFPAINLAVIAAAETMDVDLIIISSIGSSTYGGNSENLTYLDMEKKLFESKIINNRTVAFSYGGDNDVGNDMDSQTLEKIKLRNKDLEFIHIDDFKQNIEHRLDIYNSFGEIKLFINVGGNIVSGGIEDIGFGFDNGLINPNMKINYSDKGLMGKFLSSGIPVINFLNIAELVTEYGLIIDPVPIPKIGIEEIYYTYRYNKFIICVIFIIGGGGIIYYGNSRRKKIKEYLRDITR